MRFVLFLLLAAFLAGCADEGALPSEEDPALEGLDLDVTDDTGVIRGVVVDTAVVPIMDVTITIAGLEKSTVTNEEGAFGFDGLEPGTYFLTAERLGYGAVQQSVDVEAGVADPPAVRVLMVADPSSLPFVEGLVWEGYMACGLSVVALCGLPVVDEAVGDNFLHIHELEQDGIDYLQSEMIWKTTQTVSPNMQLWQEATGDGGCAFEAQNAPSPNIINTTWGDYNSLGDRDCFETLGNTTNLRLRVFSGSMDGTTPPGGCWPTIPGVGTFCFGAGFTVEQGFTVFSHVFYGFKPFDGWQFSVDGVPSAS